MQLRRAVSGVSYTIGLIVLAAGIGHSVAVTWVAHASRDVFDQRNLTLLIVGLVPLLSGLLLILNAPGVARGSPGADLNAGLGAGAMFLVSVFGANFDGFWLGLLLMGGFITALILVRRAEARRPRRNAAEPAPGSS